MVDQDASCARRDLSQGVLATRKPMLLFVLSGVLLLRYEERTLFVLLFQEPPRSTRFVVDRIRADGSLCEAHAPWSTSEVRAHPYQHAQAPAPQRAGLMHEPRARTMMPAARAGTRHQ